MLYLLADPPQWLYLVLGALLVVTGAIAAQKQDRCTALAFGVAFLLMLATFIFDKTQESPREEAERRTHLMQMAIDAKNSDAFAENLADKVLIKTANGEKTLTREELKNLLKGRDIKTAVWDFSRDDVKDLGNGSVEIGFLGKGNAQGNQIVAYFRATYTKQPDGSYKLTALSVHEPLDRSKLMSIPGLP